MCSTVYLTQIRKSDTKKEGGGQNGGVGKIGKVVLQKGGITYFHTN